MVKSLKLNNLRVDTVSSSPSLPPSFPEVKGFDFDGVDDTVFIGNHADLQDFWAGGASISFWVNPRSDGGSNFGYWFDDAVSTGGCIAYGADEDALGVRATFYAEGSSIWRWRTNNRAVLLGQANLVICSFNSTTMAAPVFTINDVDESFFVATTGAGAFIPNSNQIRLGGNGGSRTSDGIMSHVCIYDKILSTAEKTEVWNSGRPVDMATTTVYGNLLRWFKLGDGDTFNTAIDQITANNGTMTNMTADDIVTFLAAT